ncbi:TRAP transporter substrate-binding protein [Paenalcaligenes hominis]|uniref:TRAP transporter substrate-binding protein n=1 Tax=Paenalcaligenes hominis TaxID=643674 RepID=UPI00352693E3
MKKSTKAIVLASLFAISGTAFANKPITLRVHHFLASHSNAQENIIEPWCKKVQEESKNRLQCQIYPAAQLGGTPAQFFDQAKDGIVDLVWTIPTYASGRFTKTEVFELPWLTQDAESGSKAFWEYINEYADEEYKGVKPIFVHVHDGTLLHLKGKEAHTMEDLKGLKIRVPTRINSRVIELLGATPVQMPQPQVPESLAKGVIDGATSPWEGTLAIKLNEVAKWHLDVPEGKGRLSNTTFLFGMNPKKYEGLPDDLKAVIDANSGLEVSGWAGRVGFDEQRERFMDDARQYDGQFVTITSEEYDRWVKKTAPIVDEWITEVNAKGGDGEALYKKVVELTTKYQTQ